jgi:RNA polymerase sigma-70 factor (ECF subfamily)
MIADEISDALDDLPEDFRMAVLLVDVQELSYKEAALALGCPIGTVMSRLHRGRRMLKSRLVHQAQALGLISSERPLDSSDSSDSSTQPLSLEAFRSKKRTVS